MVILIKGKSLVKEHIEDAKAGNVAKDFIESVFEKAKALQAKYGPFITIPESATVSNQNDGRLLCLPISVKDSICTAGVQATAGSKILEGYIPPFDATAVRKVKGSGAFILGKTTMDEFGFGTFNTNSAFSVPKNPYDLERACGGSSGGAACLTAVADFPHIALAQSTGGSITAPAAFTGTVGITPTYGRVSRYGLIDYSNSMDKIGTIGKCVYDAALGLQIISGHDPLDGTSSKQNAEDYIKSLDVGVKGMRLGVPREYFADAVDERISKLVMQKIDVLASLGAEIREISLPLTKYAIAAYYIIATTEASTNLARYCGLRYGHQEQFEGNFSEYFARVRSNSFGDEAKRRIMLGTYARMAGLRDAYYVKALKVRQMIIEEFGRAFNGLDALVAPSMPVLPPRFNEIAKLSPREIYALDVLTVPSNMAGMPSVSLPAGFVNGLPVGIQVMSDHFKEQRMLAVASAIEGSE